MPWEESGSWVLNRGPPGTLKCLWRDWGCESHPAFPGVGAQGASNPRCLPQVEPYLPYEYTCEGMLERLHAYIQHQVGGRYRGGGGAGSGALRVGGGPTARKHHEKAGCRLWGGRSSGTACRELGPFPAPAPPGDRLCPLQGLQGTTVARSAVGGNPVGMHRTLKSPGLGPQQGGQDSEGRRPLGVAATRGRHRLGPELQGARERRRPTAARIPGRRLLTRLPHGQDFCTAPGPAPPGTPAPQGPLVLAANASHLEWAQNASLTPGAWPPARSLRAWLAAEGRACTDACLDHGLICEPAFFPFLNSRAAFQM